MQNSRLDSVNVIFRIPKQAVTKIHMMLDPYQFAERLPYKEVIELSWTDREPVNELNGWFSSEIILYTEPKVDRSNA